MSKDNSGQILLLTLSCGVKMQLGLKVRLAPIPVIQLALSRTRKRPSGGAYGGDHADLVLP